MNQKIPTIIGTVIIIILAFAAGYFVWLTQKNNPIETQVIIQPVDETTNWQTYKNEQYGFEFKYPNGRVINSEEKNELGVPSFTLEFPNNQGNLTIIIEENPERWDAIEIKKKYFLSGFRDVGEGYPYKEEFLPINGINSFKQSRYDLGIIEYYFIPREYKLYKLNFEFNFSIPNENLKKSNQKVIDKILSTFKFTN